jgi:ribosomal protein S18 acetylase RimI-like enzyme
MRTNRSSNIDPILYQTLTDLWNRAGISNPARADTEDAIRVTLENGGCLVLAYQDDGGLIGSAWLTHDFRRLYIHHMAVLPEFQNRGIGDLILREALAIADEMGLQAKLEVHKDNPAARHLYAKYGFTDLDGYITMIRRR